jgi:transposase-like protein
MIRPQRMRSAKADWGKISIDLKAVYHAVIATDVKQRFAEFAQHWQGKYPSDDAAQRQNSDSSAHPARPGRPRPERFG